jgi:tetratricopeptide (TPR) repeat protein
MQITKIKIALFLVLLMFPLLIQSQKKSFDELIKKDILNKSIIFKSETNFNKAQSFFIKKNWDSTLVYSMKYLNSNPKKELVDYCHLFRGVSFRELKLFKEAKNEFLLVSNKYAIYNFINMNLGSVCLELSEFNKAIYYYQKADKYSQNDANNCDIDGVYENLGVCYLHLKQFDKSEKFFFQIQRNKRKRKRHNQSFLGEYQYCKLILWTIQRPTGHSLF